MARGTDRGRHRLGRRRRDSQRRGSQILSKKSELKGIRLHATWLMDRETIVYNDNLYGDII